MATREISSPLVLDVEILTRLAVKFAPVISYALCSNAVPLECSEVYGVHPRQLSASSAFAVSSPGFATLS